MFLLFGRTFLFFSSGFGSDANKPFNAANKRLNNDGALGSLRSIGAGAGMVIANETAALSTAGVSAGVASMLRETSDSSAAKVSS